MRRQFKINKIKAMKKLLECLDGAAFALKVIVLFVLLTLATSANGQSYTATDGYVSAQSGTATNYTEVVFAGSPTKSIRLLSVDLQSETNSAFLYYYSGTAPYTVTGVINGTNLVVTSNAGIVTNQLAILQIGGTNWTAMILYTNQLTNVFLAGGATLGFTPLTNSVLWHCGNRHLVGLGITKRQVAGESLFAAQVRAPLAVRIDPGVVTSNRLNATVKYGTEGSP